MAAQILDGKSIAANIQEEISEEVVDFIENNSFTPCLAAVLVGEDPASEVYVRNKQRACERVGITSQLHRLEADDEHLHQLPRLSFVFNRKAVGRFRKMVNVLNESIAPDASPQDT